MKKKLLKSLAEMKDLLPDTDQNKNAITHLMNEVTGLTDITESKSILSKPEISEDYDLALYSDGACRGNPGPGGWGIVGQRNTGELLFESYGFAKDTTNNRMELSGAIESLKHIKNIYFNSQQDNDLFDEQILLFSDSKYVVDGIQKWVPGWKRRGWKKADKKAPENLDLWKDLDLLFSEFTKLEFRWVKGHSGHPQNERCDELANQAIDENL